MGGEGVPPVGSLTGVLAGTGGGGAEALVWVGRAVVSLVTSVTGVDAGPLALAGLVTGTPPVASTPGGCGAAGTARAVAAPFVWAAFSRAALALAREG